MLKYRLRSRYVTIFPHELLIEFHTNFVTVNLIVSSVRPSALALLRHSGRSLIEFSIKLHVSLHTTQFRPSETSAAWDLIVGSPPYQCPILRYYRNVYVDEQKNVPKSSFRATKVRTGQEESASPVIRTLRTTYEHISSSQHENHFLRARCFALWTLRRRLVNVSYIVVGLVWIFFCSILSWKVPDSCYSCKTKLNTSVIQCQFEYIELVEFFIWNKNTKTTQFVVPLEISLPEIRIYL